MAEEHRTYLRILADLREDARWVRDDGFQARLVAAADYMAAHPPAGLPAGAPT